MRPRVASRAVPSPPLLLAADIGGTHARFLLARRRGETLDVLHEATLAVADHATPEAACAAFLADCAPGPVARACLAVAGPVEGRRARLTNAAWELDADRLASSLAIDDVTLCNDFAAAAFGVGEVPRDGLLALQAAESQPRGMRVVIGAGTGLGVAYLMPGTPPSQVIAGEGGHASFAPVDVEQAAVREFVAAEVGRVSNEHLLSGAGIVRLYAFAAGNRVLPPDVASEGAAAVVRRADAGEQAADDALRLFVSIFGGVAGDHALAVLATGGVYVAGGIAPRLADRFAGGEFNRAFTNKGAHGALLRRMPVLLVRETRLGLLGAAMLASETASSTHA